MDCLEGGMQNILLNNLYWGKHPEHSLSYIWWVVLREASKNKALAIFLDKLWRQAPKSIALAILLDELSCGRHHAYLHTTACFGRTGYRMVTHVHGYIWCYPQQLLVRLQQCKTEHLQVVLSLLLQMLLLFNLVENAHLVKWPSQKSE